MNYTCPLPDALTTIQKVNCPFRFDQIVMLIFMQSNQLAFGSAEVGTLATWTPLLTADDDSKVVISPMFSGFVIPASEAMTNGGNDNSTLFGIPDYFGEGTVNPTGMFKNLTSAVIRQLNDLTQFSLPSSAGASQLQVMMVNKDGIIFYHSGTPTTSTSNHGFPIYNFRVSSTGSEGFNAHNVTNFGFNMRPEWDQYMISVKPSFDPFTQLVNS